MVLQPGQRYGTFEIIEHLGSGGFGHVYKVRDPRFPQPMALKLSLAPVTEADVAQRALREVTVLRALKSPHVVKIYDCGLRRDGHIYVLMEFLKGRPLDRWHDFDRPLPPAWACHVVYQCCLGLLQAHDRGIVHRDLKPANIFVDREVFVRLLDFGLARSWDDQTIIGVNATHTNMLVGTPHYAQPEQMQTNTLTPAADVYSLGIILYELLTGHAPFVADRPVSAVINEWRRVPIAWMRAHTADPVVPIARYISVTESLTGLVSLVERTLAKDPRARPANARVFAEQLKAAWPTS